MVVLSGFRLITRIHEGDGYIIKYIILIILFFCYVLHIYSPHASNDSARSRKNRPGVCSVSRTVVLGCEVVPEKILHFLNCCSSSKE